MDGAEQVLDYVFKLALALDDGGHGLQLVGFNDALDESDSMALGDMIEVEALGSLGLDADLVDAETTRGKSILWLRTICRGRWICWC